MCVNIILERALAKLRKYRQEHYLNDEIEQKPTPSEIDIIAAEKAISASLPESYKYFVCHAGSVPLIFDEVFWVGSEGTTYRDIVKVYREEMSEGDLQNFLIPFYADGYGNYVCFDTRKNDSGEYSIVFWDHEEQLSAPSDDLGIVADNFAEWYSEEVENHIDQDQDIRDEKE